MRSLILFIMLSLFSLSVSAQEPVGICYAPGKLIVFLAGSMSVPVQKLVQAFTQKNHNIKVFTESAGSRTCARKIVDLHKDCDIMISADVAVIEQLLMPKYASWAIIFAGNEMGLAYTPQSRHAADITTGNWFNTLTKTDVNIGRSDPNSDPCGYRTVLLYRLAEHWYKKPGLAKKLLSKNPEMLRPKETDLLALLEIGNLDYVPIYRSVAVQHKLQFLSFPPEFSLCCEEYAENYAQVSVELAGATPGTIISRKGAPISYALTVPKTARHKDLAFRFISFMLSPRGRELLEDSGMTFKMVLIPKPSALPRDLLDLLPGGMMKLKSKTSMDSKPQVGVSR